MSVECQVVQIQISGQISGLRGCFKCVSQFVGHLYPSDHPITSTNNTYLRALCATHPVNTKSRIQYES